MNNYTIDTANEAQHEGITATQDKILSITPIPSAILSIFGSSVILYMAISTRRQRKWTTYTRLLIGLSVCDIISSVSLAFSPFMRRPESGRVWAVGNDATCTAIGTMTQFSYSNLFFNAMLSYYFMITVRFQMKHSRIAKLVEPWMHFISIGYPLCTSVVGAAFGMYGEKATGMGCWVNEYPHGCGAEPGHQPCTSIIIGWMFFGLPLLFSGISIIINNLIIACYVWTPIKSSSSRSRSSTAESFSSSSDDEFEAKEHMQQAPGRNKQQLRRLRLVSSQAFLFVLSFAVCNLWLGILGIIEAGTLDEDEPQLMRNMYWLIVLNALLSPLQGFLNMLVYIRPKVLKNRQDFPLQTKMWAARRAILGESVRVDQLMEKHGQVQSAGLTRAGDGRVEEDMKSSEPCLRPLQKDKGVSSITLSRWDHFDQDESEFSEDLQRKSDRWLEGVDGDIANAVPTSRHKSQSDLHFHSSISSLGFSLPFISENVDDTSNSSDNANGGVVICQQSSEDRRGSTTADIGSTSQNLDGFNNKQLSISNHTKSSEDRWSSTAADTARKASKNQLSISNHSKSSEARWSSTTADMTRKASKNQLSISNHTISSKSSSVRLVPPVRLASEHDEVATAHEWANESPLIAPKRLPSEYETVEDTVDNKEVVSR